MKELALVFAVGLWLGIILNFPYKDVFYPTEPYSDVTVKFSNIIDDTYFITASFIKNECKFKKLEIFGHSNTEEEWTFLPYENLPGPTGEAVEGDRVAGEHTLRLSAALDGRDYDKIQIRTRHDCSTTKNNVTTIEAVDRVFYTEEFTDE